MSEEHIRSIEWYSHKIVLLTLIIKYMQIHLLLVSVCIFCRWITQLHNSLLSFNATNCVIFCYMFPDFASRRCFCCSKTLRQYTELSIWKLMSSWSSDLMRTKLSLISKIGLNRRILFLEIRCEDYLFEATKATEQISMGERYSRW